MNRAILFVLGLVIGVIAAVLWKQGEINSLTTRLNQAEQQIQASAAQVKQLQGQVSQLQGQVALLSKASVVFIGPNSGDLNPSTDLVIYFSQAPVVYWKPWQTGAGHTVKVVFTVAGFPAAANGQPPFVNGKPNTTQQISCSGETCFSYDVNPNLGPILTSNPNGLTYKYSQSIDNQPLVDGRIIIKQGP